MRRSHLAALLAAALLTLSLSAQPAHRYEQHGSAASASAHSTHKWFVSSDLVAGRPDPLPAPRKPRPKPHVAVPVHRIAPKPKPPAPAPAAPPQGGGYSGSVPDLIRSVFGSASSTALCIAHRESRFDPYAKNAHSSASGIFQMTRVWWDGYWHFDPFNAYLNVTYAHKLYLMSGWGPWGGGCNGQIQAA